MLLFPILYGFIVEIDKWLQMLTQSGQHGELVFGQTQQLLLCGQLQLLFELLEAELHNVFHLDALDAQARQDDGVTKNELRLQLFRQAKYHGTQLHGGRHT